MPSLFRNKNFYLMFAIDGVFIVAAYFFAYLLRFEGNIPFQEWGKFNATLPYLLIFKLIIFMTFGLYRGMWHYTSFVDLINVLKATATSSGVITLAILFKGIVRTPHGKIFVLKGNSCDLNWLNQKIEELVTLAYDQDVDGIKSKLKEIVPEYQPFDMNNHTPPNPPMNLSDSTPPLSDLPRRYFIPAAGDHRLWPWRNVQLCDRDVAPHGREAGDHGLCP